MVIAAQRGDRAAFAMLVKMFERSALAMAYAVVGDASGAGDVTQDAFLRAWQKLHTLDDPNRFGAWLARIVRNRAADQLRGGRRNVSIDNAQDVADPANDLEHAERRRLIDAAMMQLDELTRSAMALRYYENLGSREIAGLLGLSASAVDMRLSRGRAELRDKLEALNPNVRCKT
jgi:RNA polymerase sigma-70 factor (ECF subfamily)